MIRHDSLAVRLCTFAIAACPIISSGLVGSSIHNGLYGANFVIQSMDSCTSHFWLASTIYKTYLISNYRWWTYVKNFIQLLQVRVGTNKNSKHILYGYSKNNYITLQKNNNIYKKNSHINEFNIINKTHWK